MQQSKYEILIACYKSVQRLDTLISSLNLLDKNRIRLHFSVDGSSEQSEVVSAIEELKDIFDIGLIIRRDEHLGLKQHMTECIGTLAGFDTGGVLLEDDLFVDSNLLEYLDEYVPQLAQDGEISSLGLYHQHYYHYSSLPFWPYEAGPYKMRYPCSSGLYMSNEEARELYRFMVEESYNERNVVVPRNVLQWSDSWKKYYCIYLELNVKYVLYPDRSVVTNTGVAGTHTKASSSFYQSPLGQNQGIPSVFPVGEITNKYDVFMEPISDLVKRIQPDLGRYDFDVDLEGDRALKFMRKRYLLSSKPCEHPIMQFGDELKPLLHNVKFPNKKGPISFGLTEHFSMSVKKAYVARFESMLPPISKRLLLKMLWRQIIGRS